MSLCIVASRDHIVRTNTNGPADLENANAFRLRRCLLIRTAS
jgi:hypothetical protein